MESKMDFGFTFRRFMFNTCIVVVCFAELLFIFAKFLVREATYITTGIILYFGHIDVDAKYCGVPMRFIASAVILPSCIVPVTIFIVFVIASAIITLGGFLLIEGTIVVVGGLCTCACIIALLVVLSALTVTLMVFYMLALKVGCVLKIFEPPSDILQTIPPLNSNGQLTELTHTHQN